MFFEHHLNPYSFVRLGQPRIVEYLCFSSINCHCYLFEKLKTYTESPMSVFYTITF